MKVTFSEVSWKAFALRRKEMFRIVSCRPTAVGTYKKRNIHIFGDTEGVANREKSLLFL